MDYEGQKLAELLFYWIILLSGGVGWIFGYMEQDFTIVFKFWTVGVVLSVIVRIVPSWEFSQEKASEYCTSTSILSMRNNRHDQPSNISTLFLLLQLCVPDWPFYNRNPIKWLESIPDRREHIKSS
jgi:signal peptidase complex subunit 1